MSGGICPGSEGLGYEPLDDVRAQCRNLVYQHDEHLGTGHRIHADARETIGYGGPMPPRAGCWWAHHIQLLGAAEGEQGSDDDLPSLDDLSAHAAEFGENERQLYRFENHA